MLPPQQTEYYRAILLRPVVTEKSMRLIDQANQYTFEVKPRTSKIEIRRAVEALYGVRVLSVRTISVKGKKRRMGYRYPEGRTASWKKAIVTLAPGDRIDVVERG